MYELIYTCTRFLALFLLFLWRLPLLFRVWAKVFTNALQLQLQKSALSSGRKTTFSSLPLPVSQLPVQSVLECYNYGCGHLFSVCSQVTNYWRGSVARAHRTTRQQIPLLWLPVLIGIFYFNFPQTVVSFSLAPLIGPQAAFCSVCSVQFSSVSVWLILFNLV